MAENPYFTQFLANVLGRALYVPSNKELTAYGCALLASEGVRMPLPIDTQKVGMTIQPNTHNGYVARERFADAVEFSVSWGCGNHQ